MPLVFLYVPGILDVAENTWIYDVMWEDQTWLGGININGDSGWEWIDDTPYGKV